MKSIFLSRRLFVLILGIAFSFGSVQSVSVMAQARRQPPSSDQKKNKRPTEGQTDEKKEEPLPPELVGKPQ
ncbi:MAG: hypothetical protein QOF72_668, partial [Blastocatellia bacterium]|nr:hypothetical protein [Blastocatellia bacterium]